MNAISASTSSIPSSPARVPARDKIKQDFDALSKALDAGNADDAKTAFAQLQKDAPQLTSEKSPLAAKVDALGKAVASGDIDAAQKALSDLKASAPKGHPPGGGRPAGGASSSGAAASTSSSKTYDKMDANKDGVVTDAEKAAYYLKHPDQAKSAASSQSGSVTITDIRQLAAQGQTDGDE